MHGFGGAFASAAAFVSNARGAIGLMPAPAVGSGLTNCAIDISHYQGAVAWSLVPPEITIVMVKATEGTYFVDPLFHQNKAGAEASGRRVIPYHFCTTDDPHAQAAFFIKASGLQVREPFGLDWETYGHMSEITVNVHRTGFDLMEHTERLPLGYWGVYPPGAPDAFMKSWPWWLARYPLPNDGSLPAKMMRGGWTFWQYTDRGSVPGIQGLVDRSLFNGSAAEALDWFDHGK